MYILDYYYFGVCVCLVFELSTVDFLPWKFVWIPDAFYGCDWSPHKRSNIICVNSEIAFQNGYRNFTYTTIWEWLLNCQLLIISRSICSAPFFLRRYGSWACCFTYGTFLALDGLTKCDLTYETSLAVRNACSFLLRHQNKNGGWGEDFTSCYNRSYAKFGMQQYGDEGSGTIQTSWAVLALMSARCPDISSIKKGKLRVFLSESYGHSRYVCTISDVIRAHAD